MAKNKKPDITDPKLLKAIQEFNLGNPNDFPLVNANDPNAPVNRSLPISNIGGPPELAGYSESVPNFMGPVNDPLQYNAPPSMPPDDVLKALRGSPNDAPDIRNALLGAGGMVGIGAAGKNVNLLGPGLNTLGNNIGTGIRGAGSAIANNIYPTAVLADMARKGFDPNSDLRQGMNAENIPASGGVVGEELGKSATGESITKQKGLTDLMRTIGSFLGGIPKGAAQGVGSAVGNVEQLGEPIVKGVGSIPGSFMKGYAGTQPTPGIPSIQAPSDTTLNIGGKDYDQHALDQIANYMKANGYKVQPPDNQVAAKGATPGFMNRLHQVTNEALANSPYAQAADMTSYLATGKGIPYNAQEGRLNQLLSQIGKSKEDVAEQASLLESSGKAAASKRGQLSGAEDLRKEIKQDPRLKDFFVASDFYNTLQGMKEKPGLASPLSLLYVYSKMMDPGGRVTASDIESGQNLGNLPERVQSWVTSWLGSGKKMTGNQMNALSQEIETAYQARLSSITPVMNDYRSKAIYSGYSPEIALPFIYTAVTSDKKFKDEGLPGAEKEKKKKKDPDAPNKTNPNKGL